MCYLGKGWGYFLVWFYWLFVVFIGMVEIIVIFYYVQFWFFSWLSWMIEIGFLIILVLVNLIVVKFFGEVEFWFVMVKIVVILVMIVIGVFMVLIGFKILYGVVSLVNIVDNFLLFFNGGVNFVMVFQMVFFVYFMIEFIGVIILEIKNLCQVLLKVVKEIFLCIVFFYGGVFLVIMFIILWCEFVLVDFFFVMVFELVGIKWAAVLINFVVLILAVFVFNLIFYLIGCYLYQIVYDLLNLFLKVIKVDIFFCYNVL